MRILILFIFTARVANAKLLKWPSQQTVLSPSVSSSETVSPATTTPPPLTGRTEATCVTSGATFTPTPDPLAWPLCNSDINLLREAYKQSIISEILEKSKNQTEDYIIQALNPCTLGDSESNPAASCRAIYECDPNRPSGYYHLRSTTAHGVLIFLAYCDMTTVRCGVRGGWTRVADLDMKNHSQNCPTGFSQINSPRICRGAVGRGCSSVTYKTHSVPFSIICGKAKGYQYHSPDAFGGYPITYRNMDINHPYVDGVSITYGSPRHHIFTYAVGVNEGGSEGSAQHKCHCAVHNDQAFNTTPTFVGADFHCESGNYGHWDPTWYTSDPLWDGEGCPSGNNCCSKAGLPYFCRTLPVEVRDDLEVRICVDQGLEDENIGLEELQLFIY